jgi:uncharacterized RDD family membrane protein YckC
MDLPILVRRVLAHLVDSAIMLLACGVVVAALTAFPAVVLVVLALFLSWLYYAAAEGSGMQATIGKRLLGLKVTDEQGNRIGLARASVRFAGKFLSTATLGIGFLMVVFTEKDQGLHDKIAKTLVVKR